MQERPATVSLAACRLAAETASGASTRAAPSGSVERTRNLLNLIRKTAACGETRVRHPILGNTIGNAIGDAVASAGLRKAAPEPQIKAVDETSPAYVTAADIIESADGAGVGAVDSSKAKADADAAQIARYNEAIAR